MKSKGADKSKQMIYLPTGLLGELRIYVATEKATAERAGEISISGVVEQALTAWLKSHKKPKK